MQLRSSASSGFAIENQCAPAAASSGIRVKLISQKLSRQKNVAQIRGRTFLFGLLRPHVISFRTTCWPEMSVGHFVNESRSQ